MKCGWRLSEAVQVTHKLPSSAGYFAGPCRKDMRYSARRPRRLRILPYVISSGRVLVGSARRPNLQLDVFPVTHPLAKKTPNGKANGGSAATRDACRGR